MRAHWDFCHLPRRMSGAKCPTSVPVRERKTQREITDEVCRVESERRKWERLTSEEAVKFLGEMRKVGVTLREVSGKLKKFLPLYKDRAMNRDCERMVEAVKSWSMEVECALIANFSAESDGSDSDDE